MENQSTNYIIMAVWILLGILFLMVPCLSNRYRRELWWKRLRTFSWNVQIEPEPEPFRRDAGRNLFDIDAEEEQLRHILLLERIAPFTSVVTQAQIPKVTLQTESPKYVIHEGPVIGPDICLPCASGLKNYDHDQGGGKETEIQSENPSLDIEMAMSNKPEVLNESLLAHENNSHQNAEELRELDDLICIPIPGHSSAMTSKTRLASRECPICLCSYAIGDRITWSATESDPHVFHEECILKYLISLGSKVVRPRDTLTSESNGTAVTLDFDMLCPCCRQPFISSNSSVIMVTNEKQEITNELENTQNTSHE